MTPSSRSFTLGRDEFPALIKRSLPLNEPRDVFLPSMRVRELHSAPEERVPCRVQDEPYSQLDQ